MSKKKEIRTDMHKLILDHLPLMTWVKDPEGHYLAMNKPFADYVGLPEEKIRGKNDWELYSQEDAQRFVESDRRVMSGIGEETMEYSPLEGLWNEEYKRVIREEGGDVLGVVGVCQDITRRHSAEQALRESEMSLSVLLSNLPGVAYRSLNDKDWTMVFLSQGCLELTGYTPAELIYGETTYYDLILPEDREKVMAQWDVDVAAGMRSNDEYRIRTKSGEIKWIWEQSIPVPAHDGPSYYSEGFIQDISKTKKAEAALKASEEQFKAIFEEAPLGIGIFSNHTGKALRLNPKFAEIHKREIDELMNLDWIAYSHPDEIYENQLLLRQMMDGETNGFSMDKRIIRGDGTIIWVNMVITPYHVDTGESCHLCMMEDVTFSKMKEQEIEYLSYHDSLTGLFNRRLFEEEMRRISISRKLPVSIIMGDVNGLKLINDSFGHKAGDRLLQEAAMLLRENCRDGDFIARIGGDEFVIILEGADQQLTEQISNRIQKSFRAYSSRKDKRTFYLSISLGSATKTSHDQTMDLLMKEADEKQYQKKHQMKKRIRQEILAAIKSELEQNAGMTQEAREELGQIVREVGTLLHLSPARRNNLRMLLEICEIGRLTLPASLRKKPVWEMTPEEYQKYAIHAETGHRIVSGAPEMKKVALDLMAHHENWDGTGYPKGLKGREIPLLARIARAVDFYQETAQGNPPVNKRQLHKLITSIKKAEGTLLDPEIGEIFTQVLESRYGRYLQ
jgi:diguanylate cyclase (GGDEF)-like protein/PAS domain S-box-containing protein